MFNDRWDDIGKGEGEGGNDLAEPTTCKELAILWKSKDKKAYALISLTVSEEVSRQICQKFL